MKESFGDILKRKREEKGFSLRQLAIKTGISHSYISEIEKNKFFKRETIEKLIKALNIEESVKKIILKKLDYLNTPTEVLKELEELKQKGNAQIINTEEEILIPVYGDISAGNGKIIFGDVVGEYAVSADMRNIDELIAIRVAGNSMEHRIPDKSYVLIRKGIEVESGEIGAFCLGEECFVKVLKIYGGTPVLRSLNSSYEDIEITEDDEFFAIGKIIECKIKF